LTTTEHTILYQDLQATSIHTGYELTAVHNLRGKAQEVWKLPSQLGSLRCASDFRDKQHKAERTLLKF